MEKNREFDLSVSTYGVARQYNYDVVILPWGATEPHNLHLPYLTDCILSHDIAVEAAVKAYRQFGIRAMVMPPVQMGSQNPGQRDLPFCVHYRYETQRAILSATGEWFKMADPHKFFDQPGDHADEVETSVMMYYHPELVNLDEAGPGKGKGFKLEALKNHSVWMPRNWGKISPHDTGVGDPSRSTAEKGKRFAEAVTDQYARFLNDFAKVRDEDELYE